MIAVIQIVAGVAQMLVSLFALYVMAYVIVSW